MSQVSVFSKTSVTDFFGQPAAPANPPTGQCRMFYNVTNDTFHVIDSNGVELLGGGGGAPINSPAFTGTPTAPTASPLTNNTQLATTAYADLAVAANQAKWQVVRSTATAFTQAGVTGPIAMTFAVPFADGNYTVIVTASGNEVAPGTPTIVQFPSVGVSYYTKMATPGNGINVWVANNDSIAHTGVVHVMARHD